MITIVVCCTDRVTGSGSVGGGTVVNRFKSRVLYWMHGETIIMKIDLFAVHVCRLNTQACMCTCRQSRCPGQHTAYHTISYEPVSKIAHVSRSTCNAATIGAHQPDLIEQAMSWAGVHIIHDTPRAHTTGVTDHAVA